MTSGDHRRITDEVNPDASQSPGRREPDDANSPHRRLKQDFFRKYRQPLIGLGLAGASLPLVNAQQNAEKEKAQTAEGEQAAQAAAAARSGDAEEDLVGRIAESRASSDRSSHIQSAVAEFKIEEGLAADIYDIAKQEGVEPKVAYGLVRTESTFDDKAVSHVGARGLTQVMPRTAKWLVPGTTAQDLFDRKTNLKLGFRYLNQLTDKYRGNMKLALLAYNRGPGTVDKVLKKGGNPDNGYAKKVMGI